MDERRSRPAREDRAVGLPEVHGLEPLDAEGLENRCREPRQFGAGVDEHAAERASPPATQRVLDLDVRAEGAHVVCHVSSIVVAKYHRSNAVGANPCKSRYPRLPRPGENQSVGISSY